MAEVKNVFIKSKMNKDLDDRLLPSGEYRDAMNIAVSKSESSDVGALENIVGNQSVIDFYNFLGVDDLICIGYLRSEDTNTIFFFLTDNLKAFKAKILALLIGISLIGGFGSFLFFTYNFLSLIYARSNYLFFFSVIFCYKFRHVFSCYNLLISLYC